MITNRYKGQGLPPDGNTENTFPYLAEVNVVKAVNMAIALHKPLLVKGPPGCGKTRLAASIAHELGLPLYEWYIKSTSKAGDGLYTIDMIRRLQDAQMNEKKAQKLTNYIRFGPLGEAIRQERESVVLIDEIDKADIDFPNDLLREIDEKKFTIEELDESELTELDQQGGFRKEFESKDPPIIVITSNDEKELPDAFLRRCLFCYTDFPERQHLVDIVRVNTPGLEIKKRLVEITVDRIMEIKKIAGFRKEPATSELIDWVCILYHWGIDVADLQKSERLTDLPFWEMLFKYQQDRQQLSRYVEENAKKDAQ